MERTGFSSGTARPTWDEAGQDGATRFLQGLMADEPLSSLHLARSMTSLGWDYIADEYACLCLESQEDMHEGPRREAKKGGGAARGKISLPGALAEAGLSAHAFPCEGRAVGIVNLTQSRLSEDGLFARLEEMAAREGFRGGLSVVQKSLRHLSDRYRQACSAVEHGRKHAWPRPIRRFSEDVLEYAIERITASMPPESLCPKPLLLLLKHDRERGTNLFDTLKEYLWNNCSDTAACRKLYCGRSTFKYRVEKIRRMTGFDLEDCDTRILLMLCFKTIDEYGRGNVLTP